MSKLHKSITRIIIFAKYWMRLLFGKERKFVELSHYIANNPDMATILMSKKEETFYSIDQIAFDHPSLVVQKGQTVDCFVALLRAASCFAYSDLIVLHNGSYFCEIKTDSILGKSSDCNDGIILVRDDKYSYYVDIPNDVVHISNGIFLSGLFSFNYYHFTFQIIPKLQWVTMIPSSIPLLIDNTAREIPSFADILDICNKQNRPVFIMDKRVRYIVDELYYVSGQTFLEPNHKEGIKYPDVRCYYKPSTIDFLRQTIIPIANERQDRLPKRIFLGRKYASERRSFNEEECIDCAKEFGFVVVYPEFLSLQQQILLFKNAEMIVGGSGAAFTNLVYCKEGVYVLILAKFYPALGLWSSIVDYIHGRLFYVLEKNSINHSEIHASFNIDIPKLRHSLQVITQISQMKNN